MLDVLDASVVQVQRMKIRVLFCSNRPGLSLFRTSAGIASFARAVKTFFPATMKYEEIEFLL